MDRTLRVVTDTATVAVFDPSWRGEPVGGGAEWWGVPLHEVPDVAGGDVAMVSLGWDGVYRVRLTDGALTADERAYAAGVVRGLGVRTASGRLAVGGGEDLPGPDEPGAGSDDRRVTVPAGAYDVDAYWIDWCDSPRWWREDGMARDDAPPDVVLTLRPRGSPLAPLAREPRLVRGVSRAWVFADEPREIGPMPGILLTTTVRKGPTGLTLKDCGPGGYAATLADYSAVRWKDRVRLRVVSVDHEAETFVGEFVETLAPEAGAR